MWKNNMDTAVSDFEEDTTVTRCKNTNELLYLLKIQWLHAISVSEFALYQLLFPLISH